MFFLHRGGSNGRRSIAVGVCVLLNVIDGFDILVMSTAAGAIRDQLKLDAADLGLVLSASLAGMTLGALLLAPLADRYGRRPLILACLILELVGMLTAGFSSGRNELVACRVLTGLGVGGMMPVLNTIVAELSSPARRNIAITYQAAGYPAGGLVAALVGGVILESHGWQLLLQSACVPAAIALLSVALFLPESEAFLHGRQPRRRSASGPLTLTLLLFAGATLLTQFSFYFFLSWLPSVLQQHLAAVKTGAAVALNLGGIVGDLIFALLSLRVRAKALTLGAMTSTVLGVCLLTQILQVQFLSLAIVLLVGAALFAAMAGIYALAPAAFPAHVRASGTGLAFSLGRLGGAVSPVVGAQLLSSARVGVSLGLVAMALPLVVAGALLVPLRTNQGEQ
jgi:predicted MFS family arabinose efflux permease